MERLEGGSLATVLLVNDEKILRTLLSVALARQHHTVLEASTGKRALTKAGRSATAVDLLVCQLSLPRMNGLELAAGLRAGEPSPPVLFLSRAPHPHRLEERARAAGHTVLREPFGVADFLGEVARLLPGASLRKPAARSEAPTSAAAARGSTES